jgi:hypothetical protein
MPMAEFVVRPAQAGDARAMAELFAAVAGERDGIATESPVDIEERAAVFARSAAGSVVAVARGQIVGMLHVEASGHGFGEFGMCVGRGWRGRGGGFGASAGGGRLGRAGRGCTSSASRCSRTIRLRSRCTASPPQVRLHRGRAARKAVPASEWGTLGLDRHGPGALASPQPAHTARRQRRFTPRPSRRPAYQRRGGCFPLHSGAQREVLAGCPGGEGSDDRVSGVVRGLHLLGASLPLMSRPGS